MHVKFCCCFVEVLVAVLSLDIRSRHVGAHARWKSKRLLAVVSILSHRSVASGLEKPRLVGYQSGNDKVINDNNS